MNLVTLGLVGLGAVVVYEALKQGSSGQLKTVPRPADLPPPVTAMPQRATIVPVPPPGTNVVEKPNELHPQFWYSGIVDVFGTPAMNLPPSWLVSTLTSSGFGGSTVRPDAPEAATLPKAVQVFSTPAEAKAFGFPDWALSGSGVGTRWFYGRWTGEVPPVSLPNLIKLLWRANSPQDRVT